MALGALYPVRVEASLDSQVSRWLWLVKWLLVLPHYVVLAFLWIAFVVLSVVAFFAILFTGTYPPAIFEFNVGVLRWSWRVAYYSYGALATDRYPPFTLADVPDYPAHLDVAYPRHLSRGLVLVKWWLLAVPHYLVVGVFTSGAWVAWGADRNDVPFVSSGLIGLLVLVAGVVLAVTGRYPQQVYDFVLGLNRWVLRVAAYAALMTDEYPPFRLDMGGHEAVTTIPAPERPGPGGGGGVVPWPDGPVSAAEGPAGGPSVPGAPPSPGGGATSARAGGAVRAWTGGRVASVVVGCVVGVAALGLLAAGGAATWLDNTQRDATGYLTSGEHVLASGTPAITSDRVELGTYSDALSPASLLGTVRIRVTPVDPAKATFVGVGPALTVDAYLAGLSHATVANWSDGSLTYHPGTVSPPVRPSAAAVWSASVSGVGTQTLTWTATAGRWVVVVMNADGSPGVSVAADVGATVPDLGWIAAGLLVAGGVLLAAGVLLVAVPVARAGRRPPAGVADEEEPVSYRRAG